MRRKLAKAVAALGVLGVSGAGVAAAAGRGDAGPKGLDDGAQLAGRATISLPVAVAAARRRAGGSLGEADLEYAGGRLVYNVDVGSHDVKVDASTGEVVAVDADD